MNIPTISRFFYKSQICGLIFDATPRGIFSVRFSKGRAIDHGFDFGVLARELDAYFSGSPAGFSVFLDFDGTSFAGKVLAALAKIAFGQTISYGELAARAGFPGAARAVGTVMAHNPLPFLIPCHRVIKNDGSIGRFGAGASLKRKLLRHEGVVS